MYRFDGADRRLRKMLETAVMIMESLEGYESKILYSIVGHSGDSDEIKLINEGINNAFIIYGFSINSSMV